MLIFPAQREIPTQAKSTKKITREVRHWKKFCHTVRFQSLGYFACGSHRVSEETDEKCPISARRTRPLDNSSLIS
jgi:hypothetical protein